MRVGDSVRLMDLPAGAKFRFQENGGVFWRAEDKAGSNSLYINFYESNLSQRPFLSGPLNVRTIPAEGKSLVFVVSLPDEYRKRQRQAKMAQGLQSPEIDRLTKLVEELRAEARALNKKSDQLLADVVNAWVDRSGVSACERCWRPASVAVRSTCLCDDCYDAWGEDYEGVLP